MKKKHTVYEDRAEKEAKRRRKELEYLQKHTVQCPYCGKDMLDTMTQCPSCNQTVKPTGYRPMSDSTLRKVKIITFIVGMAIAVVVVYFVLR